MVCYSVYLTGNCSNEYVSDNTQNELFVLADWWTCSYDWISSPISGSTWNHTYATEGTYTVNVTCYNNVSTQSVVVLQYIQAAIINLRLRHNGALVVNIALFITYFMICSYHNFAN